MKFGIKGVLSYDLEEGFVHNGSVCLYEVNIDDDIEKLNK